MGALPEPEPPVGAQRRSPEMAPPLRAVPRRAQPRPEAGGAGPRSAPPEAPGEAPVAGPVAPQTGRDDKNAPDQERRDHSEGASPEAPDEAAGEAGPQEGPGLDVETLQHLRSWVLSQLERADAWSRPMPALSQVWAAALEGEHLPAHPVLRVGEIARLVVSLPLAYLAALFAFCLVSAPRTGALAAAVGALWVLVSTLVSAASDLLT